MANRSINVSDEVLAQDAFERVKPELAKLAAEELLQVNLDVSAALQTILGVLPEAKALREQMVKELPSFDVASFDRLEDYALALSVTQTAYLVATEPPSDLQPLTDEAIQLRETLLRDAQALARRNLIDGAQLAGLKGVNGYKNIAQDLQILSKILQDAWPSIQGKAATTTDELKTASQMSTRLSRVVGLREQGPAQVAAATDTRLRAFTLVLRTYEDARRAVTYLRARQGDVDTIVPSLYPGRPRSRQSDAPAPATPNTAGGGSSVAGSGNASKPADVNSTQTLPAVTSATATSAAAAPKNAPASKDPFLQ
ncbi:MAG: hypothetical protein WDO74_06995 [Pseudomonadota bacterium]